MTTAPRFPDTFCSQCGQSFGPGDHGYSHCEHHQPVAFLTADSTPAEIAVRAIAVSHLEDFRAVLYWHHWCIEIAKAADRGDRATVNALTTQLDRRAGA